MKIINQESSFKLPFSVVIFGNFDGLHKGHQLLISKAIEKGKMLRLPTVLFTFEPNPMVLMGKKDEKNLLMMPHEKQKMASYLGIDYYVEFPFTAKVASMEPEDFVKQIIVKRLHAKEIIVGEDFRFGIGRKGNVRILKGLGNLYGFEVMGYKKLSQDNRYISSTWLRELVKKGDMINFEKISGHFFFVTGIVEHGQAIGKTIGFPTANIYTSNSKLLPPNGVYASYTYVNNKCYESITNVGFQPNTDTKAMVVETHILDFDQLIYGEEITIDIVHFLRLEKNIESLNHLKELIENDLKDLYKWKKSKT